MKAAVFHGPKEGIRIEDRPEPAPRPGEVKIRLRAAALNRRDAWIRDGQYPGLKFPSILGSDGAGVVVKSGSDVKGVPDGAEVVICPSLHWGDGDRAPSPEFRILGMPDDGTLAEFICVAAENVFQKPSHLNWEQAASIPLAGLTAHRALFRRGELLKGENVLVTGIGGGVALFVLQFALAEGARVWVTSGKEEKIGRARELGAEGGVLYSTDGWSESLREKAGEFDLIVDSSGGPGFNKFGELIRTGGRVVFFGGTAGRVDNWSPRPWFFKQADLRGTTMGSPRDFQSMLNLMGSKGIEPVIDQVYPMERVNDAFERQVSSEHFGKIVVSLDP